MPVKEVEERYCKTRVSWYVHMYTTVYKSTYYWDN